MVGQLRRALALSGMHPSGRKPRKLLRRRECPSLTIAESWNGKSDAVAQFDQTAPPRAPCSGLVGHSSAPFDQGAFVLVKSRHAFRRRAPMPIDACACQPAIAAAAVPLSEDSAPSPSKSEVVIAMSL